MTLRSSIRHFQKVSNDPWKRFRKGRQKKGGRGQEAEGARLAARAATPRRSVEEAGDWNGPALRLARDGDGLPGQRTKSKRGSPEGMPLGAEVAAAQNGVAVLTLRVIAAAESAQRPRRL